MMNMVKSKLAEAGSWLGTPRGFVGRWNSLKMEAVFFS
jgi:hypothetical protein